MPVKDTGGAGITVTFTVMELPLMDAVTGTTIAVVTWAVVTGKDVVGTGSPWGIVTVAGTVRIAGIAADQRNDGAPRWPREAIDRNVAGYRGAAVYRRRNRECGEKRLHIDFKECKPIDACRRWRRSVSRTARRLRENGRWS